MIVAANIGCGGLDQTQKQVVLAYLTVDCYVATDLPEMTLLKHVVLQVVALQSVVLLQCEWRGD